MTRLLLLLAFLPACSLLPASTKEKIAGGVNEYCTRVTPAERQVMRAEVNALIAPNSIRVTCAGDELRPQDQ